LLQLARHSRGRFMTAAENHEHQGSWFSILLIYGIGVLGATTISQAITVARDIAAYFHAAPQQAGWIISTPSALVAVGAVLTGWLVDRIGDKRILIAGGSIVIAGDIGVMLAGTMAGFLAMRVIEGVGYVCIAVSAVTMLIRITQGARRNLALTLWSSFIPMSFALPLALTSGLAGTGEWRWAFGGQAIALGVLLLLALPALPPSRGSTGPGRAAGLATVLRSPGPYLLGLSFAAHAFVQTGIVSTLAHTLTRFYGVSFAMASAIVPLGMVFNCVGCWVVGPLMNRSVRPLSISVVGVLGALAGGIAVGLKLPQFGVAVGVACAFFFASGLIAGLWALLPLVAPSRETMGASSGLVTQITLLGVLFGPPAAFAAQATGDVARTMVNIAVACVAMLGLLWLVIAKFSSGSRAGAGGTVQVAH
jgi:MFS transporter, DHA1 family, inner membrane transport protein